MMMSRIPTGRWPMRRLRSALAAGALLWGAACGESESAGGGAPDGEVPAAATGGVSGVESGGSTGSSTGSSTGGGRGSGRGSGTGGGISAAGDTGRNVDSIVAAILACPRDGLWHDCSLERRFSQFGLRAAEQDTQTFIPGVPVPARTWSVGGRTLRVVLLDADTAGRVFATLDSARAAPPGDLSVVWPERATLLHNANLLAIYFGGSDRQVERISNAILGGPPQPDGPPAR